VTFRDIPDDYDANDKANIKEAMDDLIAQPCSNTELILLPGLEGGNRKLLTKLVRSMAAEVKVPNADKIEVFSMRRVNAAAKLYHVDRAGYGPDLMVIGMRSNSPYKVLMAAIRAGRRETGVTHATLNVKQLSNVTRTINSRCS